MAFVAIGSSVFQLYYFSAVCSSIRPSSHKTSVREWQEEASSPNQPYPPPAHEDVKLTTDRGYNR